MYKPMTRGNSKEGISEETSHVESRSEFLDDGGTYKDILRVEILRFTQDPRWYVFAIMYHLTSLCIAHNLQSA